MRHIGHILILAYSAAIGLMQYIPAAATSTGLKESGPWILAIVVAALFVLSTLFKLGKNVIMQWAPKDDDVNLSEFDVPDTVLFGTFTGFVAINFVAHGVMAAYADAAGTLWYVTWFLADLLVLAVSYVVFKVTMKKKLQAQSTARPRPIRTDAA